MDTLNYEVLAKSGYNGYILKNAPEKVLQFGEGNCAAVKTAKRSMTSALSPASPAA